ncbi:cytochrome d ubiquinol oxidase subunit II [Chelatococcus asaccharovorans]|uniref:cytochrome d ubiquinol oxidase subunit II n=1 Tax=Chelatococcus asaccharovorans TaxID=28210 RepID=UPI00224C7106|nr:cytochrome d ubiquinol oxidase subunit II [Chelatococcus asaccharovorans]CAH1660933.1 Cytochrome d ubiquinol oxidase subunit II [Chelatococcus asaccharovorans]CAH1690148.1 Cytochrome d ubiquinol oxidase subunit II [Chelatococcus asaccharovorans]
MEPSTLALFWAGVITLSILVYVLLDGFDLGVGILFGTTHDEAKRSQMMSAIAPYWDGNETWLVVIGASLFGAFPAVYTVFLGAFYLPVLLMLVGLILRGVAFEFRERAGRSRGLWDCAFFVGSLLAAFVQGAAVGAMMRGIPVANGQFAGTSLDWLHPFPVLTGIGLALGYALLGAGWLVLKSEGELRAWAYARIPGLVAGVVVLLGLAFAVAITVDLTGTLQRGAHQLSGFALAAPLIAATSLAGVWLAARAQQERLPFMLTAVSFIAAFATLALMMSPYMIPYALTVGDAAAPDASLRFFFYAGIVVLPVIAVYTIGVYWIFRGKIARSGGYRTDER